MIVQSQYDFDSFCAGTHILILLGVMLRDVGPQQPKLREILNGQRGHCLLPSDLSEIL